MNDAGTLHVKARTFAKVPAQIIHDTTLSPGAVRLYAHMHWRYGSNRKNFEGRKSMAVYLGVSEKTVSNWIKELEAHGWVVVIERGFSPETGNYRTPFYHVFEVREQSVAFRSMYRLKDGERMRVVPEVKARVSRKGKGGKPSHNRENSSIPGNSSSHGAGNSSSHNLDSVDPDSNKEKEIPSIDGTQVPTPAEIRSEMVKATVKALKIGETAAESIKNKYTSFLMGTTPERDGKKRSNGKWYDLRIMPGMPLEEIKGLRFYLDDEEIGELSDPETINRRVASFRAHPKHDVWVRRAAGTNASAAPPVAEFADELTPEQKENVGAVLDELEALFGGKPKAKAAA